MKSIIFRVEITFYISCFTLDYNKHKTFVELVIYDMNGITSRGGEKGYYR